MPEDTYKHFYVFDRKYISWSKIQLAQRLNQREDLHLHLVSLTQISSAKLRSVNFYFTDESEPSLVTFTRSIFILPMCQNRHTSSSLGQFLFYRRVRTVTRLISEVKDANTSPLILYPIKADLSTYF